MGYTNKILPGLGVLPMYSSREIDKVKMVVVKSVGISYFKFLKELRGLIW